MSIVDTQIIPPGSEPASPEIEVLITAARGLLSEVGEDIRAIVKARLNGVDVPVLAADIGGSLRPIAILTTNEFLDTGALEPLYAKVKANTGEVVATGTEDEMVAAGAENCTDPTCEEHGSAEPDDETLGPDDDDDGDDPPIAA